MGVNGRDLLDLNGKEHDVLDVSGEKMSPKFRAWMLEHFAAADEPIDLSTMRLSTSVDASVDAQNPSVDATSQTQLDALQMMLAKGYTLDQIKGVLEALGKKSTDENGASTDNRQTREDLATLARRRERDRKYQEERRQKLKSSVDAKNGDTLKESKIDTKEEVKERKKVRTSVVYSKQFDEFWRAYPRTPSMGKFETWKAWQKLPVEERELAMAAVPKFDAWVKTQKPDYVILHAVRFLSKKRFDGFAAGPVSQAQNFKIPPWEREGMTKEAYWEREAKRRQSNGQG